ncbi:MAG: hypothetical protein ACR2LM_13875 [Pyrinomonadaceae bacterium]
MKKMALITLAFALAALVVIGIGAQQGQRSEKYEELMKASRKALDEQLPIVDYNEPKPTRAAERERRLAKDRRHNLGGSPPIVEGMTGASTVYHWPEDFPALPVEESTTIVIGKVSEAKAHISDDRSGVYSEVVVDVEKVLKDEAGIASAVVAEREGGRVRFPSGSEFRYFVDGFGIPKVGHTYMLFLKQLNDGGFSILTGYELLNGQVIPLDHSGVVPFDRYKDSDADRFVSEVLESIKKSMPPKG